ncbi:MAG: acetate/propionate family kinase, partial [Gemmatimonadota bacterium]|nr:acetate/propionate family kinase [Gemmatimonadota bacterium]
MTDHRAEQKTPLVLALNVGSSSIRFSAYQSGPTPTLQLHGKVDRVGTPDTTLTFDDPVQNEREDARGIGNLDHGAAANFLIDWLEQRMGLGSISAVGHRLVNGGPKYREAQRVTPQLLEELRGISAYAPEHLPFEIALIDLMGARAPRLPQVVCFDTTFHRDMPRVAKIVPIPRRFYTTGVERYGFHGLSYAFLMEELTRLVGTQAAHGRVVLAHLGHGSSLAAVNGGQSIDTSMGFT